MPVYVLECDECEHQWDAVFNCDEPKKEGTCPECGKHGRRIFTAPNVAIDSRASAWDLDKQVAKTKNGKIGDLWDMATEMSEKRGGEHDPVKKKALKDYAKKRGGKKYRTTKDRAVDFEFRVNGRKVE